MVASVEGPALSDSSEDSSSELSSSSSEEDSFLLALACCFFPSPCQFLRFSCSCVVSCTTYYAPHADWVSILVEGLEVFAEAFPT